MSFFIRYPGRQQGEDFKETLLWEASSEETSPERLRELSEAESVSVQMEVARNPKTPKDILEKLAASGEVLVRCAVVQNPGTSEEVLLRLRQTPNRLVHRALAAYLQSKDLLQGLKESNTRAVQREFVQNLSVPASLLTELSARWRGLLLKARSRLVERAKEEPSWVAPYLAKLERGEDYWLESIVYTALREPTASPVFLARLAECKNKNIQQLIAQNPNTPQALLERFSQERGLASFVALNPSASPSLLTLLSKAKKLSVPLATNTSTPVEILQKLSLEKNDEILRGLAQNPKTPAVVLQKLYPRFLFQLAANPSTPEVILRTLSRSNDYSTQYWLVQNPKVPSQALLRCARYCATYNVFSLARVVERHPNATPEVLAALPLDYDAVRAAVYNRNTTSETLFSFAKDPRLADVSLIQSLVSHPNAPPEALPIFARSDRDAVRLIVAQHPKTPASVLEEIAQNRQCTAAERLAIAQHPNASSETLTQLATERGTRLRLALAKHPNTPTDVLQRLSESKVNEIADEAKRRLAAAT